jgi:hypothetical protein
LQCRQQERLVPVDEFAISCGPGDGCFRVAAASGRERGIVDIRRFRIHDVRLPAHHRVQEARRFDGAVTVA